MRFLTTAAVIGIALGTTPVVHRSQSLYAQSDKQPTERPRAQQPSGGQATPRPEPPASRPQAPAVERPAPPPPPAPKSTGEPELKRRKQ